MFDYNSIVSDDELTVDFISEDSGVYSAINKSDGSKIGIVTVTGTTFEASSDEIFMQYKLWQTRPERSVGKVVQIEGQNMEQLIDSYEELLIGACIETHKAAEPTTSISSRYKAAIDWLRTTDFYTAPASTRYHDDIPGGLLVHSLKVYNQMVELQKIPVFSSVNLAEATIAALAHDWCKIGFYESYQKNVKNEVTGAWEKETAYKVNQRGIPLGHGATSLYIAMKMFRLSVEQALAIRWHQGRWNVCDTEQNEFQKANSEYPMVYLIQFADEIAATEYVK